MDINFCKFQDEIKQCLTILDIRYFILDLKDLFSDRSYRLIIDCDDRFKVDSFLNEFEKVDRIDKFEKLLNVAENRNKWIYRFLSVDLNNTDAVVDLRGNWTILDNLLNMLRQANQELCVIDSVFINTLCSKEIITRASKDWLLQRLNTFGPETTMLELFTVISARTPDWYGVILYIITRQKTAFQTVICRELELDPDIGFAEMERQIMEFSKKFIEKHIQQFREENTPMEEDNSDSDCGFSENMSMDGAESCASRMTNLELSRLDNLSVDVAESIATCTMDIDMMDVDNEFNVTTWLSGDDELKPSQLVMKAFQLELAEQAVQGKNVIVYAPTGIGKTIVAIYIANEHLKRNPTGKVVFLVPLRHLVSQQYAVFKKYKNPNVEVMEMRAKSESKIGPLISHLDSFEIFVMTGGIFYNALTVDNGNKLSSITEFSLIFFDECHHCMKQNPYTKIMSEYIREKYRNSGKKMPQIVGLTASPRSNNSDDRLTMKKSILELCANLDCKEFAFVKENVENLKDVIIMPKQEVIRVAQRQSNDFETSLICLMKQCETKLMKMKNERYFSGNVFRTIPTDRSSQAYIGFVGNLRNLNNDTIEENDGKQKAFCIYRYLNAYYRGFIVHQLFDEVYAKGAIDRHLDHDGKTFTCCYDEEFNQSYKADLTVQHQSDNPSIETIKSLVKCQFAMEPDSRILIFVQQVAYTNYLVDILNKTAGITAESIVGHSNKENLKGCPRSAINGILQRFRDGEYKVLVATSVAEEGLDVPNCNMVICYGYVTNEIALIQRLGRARSFDSKYFLVLPPMLAWMESKENNNQRRNKVMMTLINEYDQIGFNGTEMSNYIMTRQQILFNLGQKPTSSRIVNQQSWIFKCHNCQACICTSEELRILQTSHVVCINPNVIKRLIFVPKDDLTFGTFEDFRLIGSMMCDGCNHLKVGKKVICEGFPYLQIRIDRCTVTKNGRSINFLKWKPFRKQYEIPAISAEEYDIYTAAVIDMRMEDGVDLGQ